MPAVSITVPGVGESITEGILARWLKPDGSAVKAGEPLFELETDKASNVVPASASGLLKTTVSEGTTVSIGATVGTIDTDAQASAAPPKPPAQDRPAASSAPTASNGGGSAALSPSARRVATEEQVDVRQVAGT